MDDSMVTGRMSAAKKQRGASILQQEGLSASEAINLMYDRIIEEGDAGFLLPDGSSLSGASKWAAAAYFIDSLPVKQVSRFDSMSKGEIKLERLQARDRAHHE